MTDTKQSPWVCMRRPAHDTAIIFIHGVLSSGERAWAGSEGATWPELVTADPSVEGAGVYVFSYRSDPFARTYSISDIVDALREFYTLDNLWNLRRHIFVCHSMGGIVARRFVVVHQMSFIAQSADLGFFLVASPSLGSREANTIHLLARILRSTQAEALRFAQTNTWLNDLDKDFINLKESGRLSIKGKELVEDNSIRIKRLLGLWTQTVEPFSAARYFGESLKIAHSDHISIAKPPDAETLQHRVLIRFIRSVMYPEPASRAPDSTRPEEAAMVITALETLDRRLTAGAPLPREAVVAFNEALLETRRYMKELESGAERSSEAENELSRLWNEAGSLIYEHNPDLAQLCFVKGNGWADERVWNDPRYRELPIRLNDMLERLLQATGKTAIDIVQGECRLDTMTWRTRVPLPPFSSPPDIALWRADGDATSEPNLEKVTADFFTASIHNNQQAGTWNWRARGSLLR